MRKKIIFNLLLFKYLDDLLSYLKSFIDLIIMKIT